jgi:hypothetical protein
VSCVDQRAKDTGQTGNMYISKQFVYIMFILQCPAYKKLFNLHTKRQKHWTKLYMYTFIKTVCVLIAVWYIAKVYVIFPVWPVSFALWYVWKKLFLLWVFKKKWLVWIQDSTAPICVSTLIKLQIKFVVFSLCRLN